MEIGLIITIVGTGMGIIIALGSLVVALFLWNRGEANSDRRDIVNMMFAMKEEASHFRAEMALEMKDFHAKLITIEQSRNNKG